MSKTDKTASRIKKIFEQANGASRMQWEFVNQKGYDFAHDNQLTDAERISLEEQGMPTFTINRIMPVVEMLNFYATANKPRWQAVGAEGSDIDVASVFSDMADYIWDMSDGSTLYANAINDAITKGVGYLALDVDSDADNGMGEVVIKNPEPFDIFVDPKCRDMLFKDANFILIRKILPKEHLISLYPDKKSKIKKANSPEGSNLNYTEKAGDSFRKDFSYKDIDSSESVSLTGDSDELVELYELYEKTKIAYVNVFYKETLPPEQLQQIQQQVQDSMEKMKTELSVNFLEQSKQLEEALSSGQIIEERYNLEIQRLQEEMQGQLKNAEQSMLASMQEQASIINNTVITEKELKILMQDINFKKKIVDVIKFFGNRIKQTLVVGDTTIKESYLPKNITEYPIVPFHFKWTGTPFSISAVSPLVGKQREINKAHQLLVHNASLGSSLRWLHEEGSIDTDYWEKYSSSPGALLPIRPGATPPTPVQPAPLASAFFTLVQEAKGDMEYLAGIYSSMMGDSGNSTQTYRGMLAMDEYGTRRIKQWMQNCLEPGLKQLGILVKEYTQSVYTAQKTFRIVQPSALQEDRKTEINIPMYNDFGEAIGKAYDYQAAKFDIRIIAGSTLPVNRWAYVAELKELMQLGVIDDIALLAETDIKNKEQIAGRKSQYAEMQGQLGSQEEQIKDLSGTIETLERQLVQAGIKGQVMQAAVEINKTKEQVKSQLDKGYTETEAKQKVLRDNMANHAETTKSKMDAEAQVKLAQAQSKIDKAVLKTENSLESIE